jgi:hypothetical protein
MKAIDTLASSLTPNNENDGAAQVLGTRSISRTSSRCRNDPSWWTVRTRARLHQNAVYIGEVTGDARPAVAFGRP